MASITSLTNSTSSTSSLYGNRNIISGLASGMDTEAMIENSVSGYKTKISSLQQKMTKLQWKQDAYRGMIAQMSSLLNKYTSYTSSTNLFSASFFNRAISTVANGANASKVSATGKSSSNVAINGIKQMAQAASYTVGTDNLVSNASATSTIDWNAPVESSKVAGSMTIEYGGGDQKSGSVFTLRFGEDEVFNSADDMAKAINEKLKEKNVNSSSGTSSADNFLRAEANDDGTITIKDIKGNNFRITSVSGDGLNEIFDETERGTTVNSKQAATQENLVHTESTIDYLKDKSINVTLDGKTKKIDLGDIIEKVKSAGDGKETQAFVDALNEKLKTEFNGKVKVEANEDGSLKFTGPQGNGSTLKVTGSNDAVGKALGLGEGGYSTTLQTNWTMEKVLGKDFDWKDRTDDKGNTYKAATLTINGKDIEIKSTDTIQNVMDKINSNKEAGVDIKYSSLTGRFALTAKETGADSKVELGGALGSALFGASKGISDSDKFLEVFGEPLPEESAYFIFQFPDDGRYTFENNRQIRVTSDMTMEDILNNLNDQVASRGGSVAFDKETGKFSYTEDGKTVDMGVYTYNYDGTNIMRPHEPKAGYVNSIGTYTAGQDAIFSATVNGETMELTRSSNTVDLDGLSVTLKGAFGYNADGTRDTTAEAITFTTNSDSDKIIDTVKAFIEDYNKLVTELHSAYSTMPLQTSSGKSYEPLTEDEQAKNTETYIKNYEEKAKTGLLFGDSDLSNLYTKLTQSVQSTGEIGSMLRSIGLSVEYSNGLSTLSLDEDKMRSALESDPDRVKNAFTASTSTGASANGIMAGLKNTLELYGKTSSGSPGILVKKAGTTLASYSLSHNELQDQIDNVQKEIEKWQDKMSTRIDFYTNQFTQLEMLINQMNSQSSALSGLMGGM